MNQMKNIVIEGREAFCATCPAPEEITHVLEALAFRLTFHMPAVTPRPYEQIAPLPAQFHYQDRCGNEVIYLHGRDVDPDGLQLPDHASRFWAYPGSEAGAYRRVTFELATRWRLQWQRTVQAGRDVA